MRPFAEYIGRRKDIMTVVEIGTACLVNSFGLIEGCDRLIGVDPYFYYPEGHVYHTDPNNTDSQQDQNLRYLSACRYMIQRKDYQHLRLPSATAAELFNDQSVDAVYIDANHAYDFVKQDIEEWLPKIRPGGILGGHDYGDTKNPGVSQAVNELLENVIVLAHGDWYVHVGRGNER